MTDYHNKNIIKKNSIYIVCFLIPIILYTVLCILHDIYPFGGNSNLAYDLKIQYSDLILYLREVLLGNADIGYSFSKSLGGSLVALYGYQLSSPFNLLIVFFTADQFQLFVFVVTALKLALCGLTFSIFIKRKYKGLLNWQVIAGTSAYAFTQYTIGQMTNLLWLDGVYLLPLLLLAVDRFIEKGKKLMLYILVIMTIVFNWYTGYMNCLFIAIYFLYQASIKSYNVYNRFNILSIIKKAVPFYVTEFLAVLGSMAFFLPVLLAQATSRGFDEGVFDFYTNGSLLEILRGFMIGSMNPSKEITLFCSTLMFIMVGCFFLDKCFKAHEKIISAIFLGLMIASLFFTPLEHIWVGFKFENSFAYRFLYLAVITFLIIACRALEKFSEIDLRTIRIFSVAAILMFLLLDLIRSFDAKRLWIEVLLIIVYTVLFICKKQITKRVMTTVVSFGILTVLLVELIFNAKIITAGVYQDSSDDYTAYVQNETKLIDQIRPEKNEFYRIEKTLNRDKSQTHDSYISNESMVYLYSGLQHYSSSYDAVSTELLKNLGYYRNEFPSFYHDPILPADSLLGIRYLLSEKEYQGYILQPEYETYNGKSVYENKYALPLAFNVSENIGDVKSNGNPFEYMNDIYTGILGEVCTIYEKFDNYSLQETDDGKCYCAEGLTEDQILYMYIPGQNLDLQISRNGEEWQPYQTGWLNHSVLPVEKAQGRASVEIKSDSDDSIQVEFYVLDYKKLVTALEEIKSGSVEDLNIGNSKVEFTASGDNVMLTIPYDPSWEVNVNGERVTAEKGADAFMLIPLGDEENVSVTMVYHVKGREAGIVLSVLSVLLLAGWGMTGKLKKKK